ncbi:MAG TPA: DHA2 family efflux MFS transporter permease subunit [Candidatus Aquilonibacter sp.]|nr:DHA2 family efflux MFS transporter permease subunit [Candidatus Aquilonibacter sp.]
MTTTTISTVPPLRPPAPRPLPSPAPVPTLVEHGTRRVLIVTGVMLAALLQMIDTTIVNVSLPTIQGNLGATVDESIWIVTAFVVANVVVIPITPWLQRRLGRKRYFLISIAGFTLTSLLCGMATSLDALIVFRIAQGAFGGGLLSTAQIVMRDTFGPKQLGLSQSIFAFATVLGPSVGPTLGGLITDNASWPWIFDVNIVPGAIAFVLIWRLLRDDSVPSREPLDGIGLGLLIVALSTLQYVLDQGQQYDWFSDPRIAGAAVASVASLAAFVVWELRQKAPIVDLRVLRHRAVLIAVLCIMANAIGVFGGALLLPQFTVDGLGFTSTQTGILVGLRALPVVLLTLWIGRLTNNQRIDLRVMIGLGLFTNGLGAIWLGRTITTDSTFMTFVGPQLLAGLGIAFVYSPLLVAVLRAVPQEAAKASSFVILAFQMSGSITAALLVTLLDRREVFHQAVLAAGATLDRSAVAQFLHGHSLAQLASIVDAQATTLAYDDVLLVAGTVVCALAPLVLLLPRKKS